MANESNLKPWPKGVSGNPDGYSRGRRISDALERWLDENPEHQADLITAIVALSTGKRSLLNDAGEEGGKRDPDLDWFKELRELIQGKATDRSEIDLKGSASTVKVVIPDNGRDRVNTPGRPPVGLPGESS